MLTDESLIQLHVGGKSSQGREGPSAEILNFNIA